MANIPLLGEEDRALRVIIAEEIERRRVTADHEYKTNTSIKIIM